MPDSTIQAAAFTSLGTAREQVNLPVELFDGTINMPVMHRVVTAYLANQREGNASTKTRGLVIGGNQKPWRQKGTGRARAGSTRSPLWPGGGTVFGPRPRSYDQQVPKKMRALARKSALNARAREDSIFIIDRFAYDAPRTKVLAGLLERLGVAGRKVLILTDGAKPNVYLSGRNMQRVEVLPYSDVSTYHLLWSDVVLIEATALGQSLPPVAETVAAPAPRRAPKAEAEAKPVKKAAAKKAAKAPAKKAATKTTAKKAAKKTTAAKAKKPAPKKKGK